MPKRVCAQCGADFIIPSPNQWAYRMKKTKGEHRGRILSFCSFSCQEQYKKENNYKTYNKGFKAT